MWPHLKALLMVTNDPRLDCSKLDRLLRPGQARIIFRKAAQPVPGAKGQGSSAWIHAFPHNLLLVTPSASFKTQTRGHLP